MSSENAFWESRVFQSAPREVVGGARGGWSGFSREPAAPPSVVLPSGVCCLDRETEAQGGGILACDTEHVRQNQGWHMPRPPATPRCPLYPLGLSPGPLEGSWS